MVGAFHIVETKASVAVSEKPAFGKEIAGVGVAVPQFLIDDVAVIIDDYCVESNARFHGIENDLIVAPSLHVIDNKCRRWKELDGYLDGFRFLGLQV